jgi:hypothetical protein
MRVCCGGDELLILAPRSHDSKNTSLHYLNCRDTVHGVRRVTMCIVDAEMPWERIIFARPAVRFDGHLEPLRLPIRHEIADAMVTCGKGKPSDEILNAVFASFVVLVSRT